MPINDQIISKIEKCNIFKPIEGWVIQYPEFAKLADEQMHTFWMWSEPEVDNDVQDLRVRMTPSEVHAVTENLKLFTLYEMHVGSDYWSGRVMKRYLRPELQRMASLFSAVEFNSHSPFYNKVNEVLFLDNEGFYAEWKQDSVMRNRMEFISKMAAHKNELLSLAAFSFIEGAVLYSSFAFFKHFQSQECGKNLIKNVNTGINLSVADENTHAVGGALLFRTVKEECNLITEEEDFIKEEIYKVAETVFQHEVCIIGRLFEKGEIGGITKGNLKNFVKHRVDLCLEYLGYDPLYGEDIEEDFIASWFYKDINSVALHDFFHGVGKEYNINWKEQRFGEVWG